MNDWEFQNRREEMARKEVGHTLIHPVLSRLLVVFFLLVVLSVPLAQHVAAFRDYASGKSRSPLPQVYDVFSLLPVALRDAEDAASPSGILSRIFSTNRFLLKEMKGFEDALDDRSVIGKWIRPEIQYVLTAWFGAGNEKAYCGERPWLFYRPGVDYLTGPPFLDPVQIRRRASGGSEWEVSTEPDPRKAILDLHQQLSKRGIALIIMPTPVKPMIHPDNLAPCYDRIQTALQNPSFEGFKAEMERNGVLVFDAAPVLMRERSKDGRKQYLATDTHWRPEAIASAVAGLKSFISEHAPLPVMPSSGYRAEKMRVTHIGDLALMLDLPLKQRLFPQETVTVRKILEAGGNPWQSEKTADVLVLGDSFSNIYSLGAMGWGEGGGFVEQLSFALQRPVDRITRNDNGSFAAREILAAELAKGRDRLAGKRLVIYQFAIRELAVGNWKRIDLKSNIKPRSKYLVIPAGEERVVRGKIKAVSAVPRPGSVAYKDHVMAIHLTDLEADGRSLVETDAMVYMMSMVDNVWTAAAKYRPGETVVLRLKAWSDVADRYERLNRSELDDTAMQFVEPCWGETVKQ